jgi:hypothetical protein
MKLHIYGIIIIHSQKIFIHIYTCIYHTWGATIAGEEIVVLDATIADEGLVVSLPIGTFFRATIAGEGIVVLDSFELFDTSEILPIGPFFICIELMNVYT